MIRVVYGLGLFSLRKIIAPDTLVAIDLRYENHSSGVLANSCSLRLPNKDFFTETNLT